MSDDSLRRTADPSAAEFGIPLSGIFIGTRSFLGPEGQPTGINKKRCDGPVEIAASGLIGDFHGDRRVHGGPEMAVHHFASENYARLCEYYPGHAQKFVPGAIGENFATAGMTEQNVCIGDVYSVGTAVLQVSQPRSPCWKINHKFDIEAISLFIQDNGITGWYYRVIQQGRVTIGDTMTLVDRPGTPVTLEHFLSTVHAHRPRLSDLSTLCDVGALSPDWKIRITARLDRLKKRR